MFGSMPTSWNTVSSWLGVGQRPKDGDEKEENKENKAQGHSESKDSIISSTSVETSGSSKEGVTEPESTEGEKASDPSGESSPDNEKSPFDGLDAKLEDVSAKALTHAKEFGNMLFSFGKTASKQVAETASKVKSAVEEKTILGDFHKEQDKWCGANKERQDKAEAAVAPWVGYNDEDNLKTQILALSQDKRNFVRNPPSGVQFNFDFEASFPVALATLQEDENLQKMRFDLVPKMVNEETFWRNYFYRVSLIRQSSQLTSSLNTSSGKTSSASSRRSSTGTSGSEHRADTATTGAESPPPGQDEFASDAFEQSGVDEDHIRQEVEKQLKEGQKASEGEEVSEEWKKELEEKLLEQKAYLSLTPGADWEAELAQELADYELVDGEAEAADLDMPDADLEEEILMQIQKEQDAMEGGDKS